jgi:hypothetical protein
VELEDVAAALAVDEAGVLLHIHLLGLRGECAHGATALSSPGVLGVRELGVGSAGSMLVSWCDAGLTS